MSEEDKLTRWLEMILEDSFHGSILANLKSGRNLCLLIKKVYIALGMQQKSLALTIDQNPKRNLQTFISACIEIGVSETDCIDPNDMHQNDFEEERVDSKLIKNLLALQSCIEERMIIRAEDQSRLLQLTRNEEIIEIDEKSLYTANYGTWEELLKDYQDLVKKSLDIQQFDVSTSELEYRMWCASSNIQAKLYDDSCSGNTTLSPSQHAKMWMLLSGAQLELSKNVGYFQQLIGTKNSVKYDQETIRQIEADIVRTPLTTEEQEYAFETSEDLRQVLVAYSVFNPHLGYCQGLNFVVFRMLHFLDKEQSFWLLVRMIERLPKDYYTTMYGVAVDQRVFLDLVQIVQPQVIAHFQHLGGNGLELSLVVTEWFLTLFASPFDQDITINMWDNIFSVGDEALFKMALALIHLYSNRLLACSSYADALSLINLIGKESINVSEMLRQTGILQVANRTKIEELRAYHRLLLATNLSRSLRESSSLIPTSTDDYAYFFTGQPPKIVHNHWTSRQMDMQWETSSHLALTEDYDYRVASSYNSQGISKTVIHQPRQKQMNWRKRFEEWQLEKRQEKYQRELSKKILKKQKKKNRHRKQLQKHQLKYGLPQKSDAYSNIESNDNPSSEITGRQAIFEVPVDTHGKAALRRHLSAPSVRALDSSCRNDRILRERAQVISFIHREANEPSSTASTPVKNTRKQQDQGLYNFSEKVEHFSFLGRLSASLEKAVDDISKKKDIID